MKNSLHDPIYFAPLAKLGGGWIASKDSPSPPPPPDYAGAATAQGAANENTARIQGKIGNPNITTPYGTQTVNWGGNTGGTFDGNAYLAANPDVAADPYYGSHPEEHYTKVGQNEGRTGSYIGGTNTPGSPDQATITQTLAPAQQALLDSQNRISQNLANTGEAGLGRVSQAMSSPMDTSGVHNLQADPAARQAAQDAAYRQATARLDPQWQIAGDKQATDLRNQGLVPGSEAYDAAMRNFNVGKNDAYSGAYNNSFSQGLNAQQADFGMQSQANTQNTQLAAYLRSLPLNELNSLRTGSQVTNPQFQQFNAPSVGQTPVMQGALAQGQANQNIYNQQAGSANAFNTGLMGMGGAVASALPWAAMFSDRRLKSNIVPIGNGWYEYDIFGQRTIGVMADEIQEIIPEAVHRHASGYLMVDYGAL